MYAFFSPNKSISCKISVGEPKHIKPAFLVSEKSKLEENEYEITKKAVSINPSYSMSKWTESKAKTEIAMARSAKMPVLNLKYTED